MASEFFYDRTMNRAQLRACRAVMRGIARIKNPDPMLIMNAFAAARAKGWMGPDTEKARTVAHPRVKRPIQKTHTGFTKVWTRKKARKLAKAKKATK